MFALANAFRSVVHQSHRLSPSIATSTSRLFSYTAPPKAEKNFAEVGEILIEADASQSAVAEVQKAQEFGER